MSKYKTQTDLDEAMAKLKKISGDELLGHLKMSYHHAQLAKERMNFKIYGEEIEYSKLCENEALERMNDRFYAIRKEMS